MKVSVGSTNPVKIAAVQAIFSRIDPRVLIMSLSVTSGVNRQPWSDEETRTGAINRACAALSSDVDYAVGFEGGVIETKHGLMTCAWCAVVDQSGALGLGGGANVLLPSAINVAMRSGVELGKAMDALVGQVGIQQGPGAIGILTDGLVTRQSVYEQILALALAPFRRPDLYEHSR